MHGFGRRRLRGFALDWLKLVDSLTPTRLKPVLLYFPQRIWKHGFTSEFCSSRFDSSDFCSSSVIFMESLWPESKMNPVFLHLNVTIRRLKLFLHRFFWETVNSKAIFFKRFHFSSSYRHQTLLLFLTFWRFALRDVSRSISCLFYSALNPKKTRFFSPLINSLFKFHI